MAVPGPGVTAVTAPQYAAASASARRNAAGDPAAERASSRLGENEGMRSIETQIEIAAPAERAWSVLMDFASYPAWNPFITEIIGAPELGQRLRVRVAPPGRKPMTFRPVVVAATRRREFGWRGRVLLPGLFDGEHRFRLEDKGRVCLLHHSERFSGVL